MAPTRDASCMRNIVAADDNRSRGLCRTAVSNFRGPTQTPLPLREGLGEGLGVLI